MIILAFFCLALSISCFWAAVLTQNAAKEYFKAAAESQRRCSQMLDEAKKAVEQDSKIRAEIHQIGKISGTQLMEAMLKFKNLHKDN